MKWTEALKQWNSGKDKWCIPRRGTPGHAQVLKIMGKASKAPKAPKAPKLTMDEGMDLLEEFEDSHEGTDHDVFVEWLGERYPGVSKAKLDSIANRVINEKYPEPEETNHDVFVESLIRKANPEAYKDMFERYHRFSDTKLTESQRRQINSEFRPRGMISGDVNLGDRIGITFAPNERFSFFARVPAIR